MPQFGYAVKHNGKFYPPNADIPEAAEKADKGASDVKGNEESNRAPEAAQKAAKGRKKGGS